MINDDRESWDRTFNVCWFGVYLRHPRFSSFVDWPQKEGHLINTSSCKWFLGLARTGHGTHLLQCCQNSRLQGFYRSFDQRLQIERAAPFGFRSSWPGHIGTSIVINSGRILGSDPKEMSDEELQEARENFVRRGFDLGEATNEQIRQALVMMGEVFRDQAPMTAAEAATVILDGVRRAPMADSRRRGCSHSR